MGLKDSEEEARAGEVSGDSLSVVSRTAAKTFPPRSHQDPRARLHLDYIHSQALSLSPPQSLRTALTQLGNPAALCCPRSWDSCW